MIAEKDIVEAAIKHVMALCIIPSPTGYTSEAEAYVEKTLATTGFTPAKSAKRALSCSLGGSGSPLVLAAHIDTLGAIVRSIKANGRIRYAKLGGYPELSVVGETCVIHTREGSKHTGTFQPVDASAHVNRKLKDFKPDEENIEILVDERAKTRETLQEIGIRPGDVISIDARATRTPTGFLKSRHLDDKASVGILLAIAELVGKGKLNLNREVILLFTTYEEVGHGGAVLPNGAEEIISVDMGAVGDDLACDEYMVSICAKDSSGPCDWEVTNALIAAAKRAGCAYAVDVYPDYSADADVSLRAGHDVRHAIVGPGVYASHGYERTHEDAIANTLSLLLEYIKS